MPSFEVFKQLKGRVQKGPMSIFLAKFQIPQYGNSPGHGTNLLVSRMGSPDVSYF